MPMCFRHPVRAIAGRCVYGSGPEAATDSRSCSCALPLSDSTGLAPGSEARIRRRAATRAATSSCRLYWANACTRPATAWLTLSVPSCAVDAVNSPAGFLPCWADVDAATAAVGQGWRRGAVHCPRPTCASRAVQQDDIPGYFQDVLFWGPHGAAAVCPRQRSTLDDHIVVHDKHTSTIPLEG
eukprot:scaffold1071_cov113-Isochrysis_galbana.AAC.4